ncbi:MAG TPA: PAS domain S-box protein [Syntrophales bacterium]|nr:PAS domain S-box protein [Syntrophales bacterium]
MKEKSKSETQLIEELISLRQEVLRLKEFINERESTEEELKKSEEWYRGVFENALVGIFQSTPEGQFIRVNPAVAKMYGYDSPNEMMSKITDVAKQHYVDPHQRDLFKNILDDEGHIEDFQIEILRTDRSRILISISARTVFDDNGKVLYYEGYQTDITEHSLLENMIKERERRYRHLVENSGDIVYTTDLQGIFTYFNSAAERVTGYATSQLFGKHFHSVIRKDYHETLDRFYEKQILEKTPTTYYEFPIVTRDGEEKWFGQQVQLIYEQGDVVGFQATARDITDRLKAEEEKHRREILSAIVETAGMVCHELNQPLQAISGHAEMLSLNLGKEHPENSRVNIMEEQIARIAGITKKLMKITKHETKPYVEEMKIIDLDKSIS